MSDREGATTNNTGRRVTVEPASHRPPKHTRNREYERPAVYWIYEDAPDTVESDPHHPLTHVKVLRLLARHNMKTSNHTDLTHCKVHMWTASHFHKLGLVDVQPTVKRGDHYRFVVITAAGRRLVDSLPSNDNEAVLAMAQAKATTPVRIPTNKRDYDVMSKRLWSRVCVQLGVTRKEGESNNRFIDRVWDECVKYHTSGQRTPEYDYGVAACAQESTVDESISHQLTTTQANCGQTETPKAQRATRIRTRPS